MDIGSGSFSWNALHSSVTKGMNIGILQEEVITLYRCSEMEIDLQ